MTEGLLIELMQLTVKTIALITAPVIITIVLVGLISQVIQTVTQLKDQSLSFVPKVFAAGLVFMLFTPWFLQLIQQYVDIIFSLMERARF